jgi:hypothetical protein
MSEEIFQPFLFTKSTQEQDNKHQFYGITLNTLISQSTFKCVVKTTHNKKHLSERKGKSADKKGRALTMNGVFVVRVKELWQ